MTDTYTPTKGLTLQTVGSNDDQWGWILNDSIKLIDSALGGTLDRVLSSDVVLTAPEVENTGYHFRGTLTDTATVIFPKYYGLAVIRNSTNQPVSCGIAGGRFVNIATHGCSAIWSDGTDFTDINQFLTISGEVRGEDATSHSNEDGGSLDISGGTGDGQGAGGPVALTGGSSGINQGIGGGVYLSGGIGSFAGGDIHLEGGLARSGGDGGHIWITAGTASGVGHKSGNVYITAYKTNDNATPGNVQINLGAGGGGLYITDLPTTDPGMVNRIWLDHGVLVRSGSNVGAAATGSFLPLSGGSISGNLQIGTATNAGYKLDVVGGATRLAGTVVTAPSIVQAVGATVPTAFSAGTLLDLVGPPASSVALTLDAFASGSSGGVCIIAGRSAPTTGGTIATQGLLSLRGMGWDGTTYSSSSRATILFQTAEAFTPTAQGTSIAFSTTKKNTLTLVEAMRLQDSGNLSLGTTTDAGYKLDVNGSFQLGGTAGLGGLINTTMGVNMAVVNGGLPAASLPPTSGSVALWVVGSGLTRIMIEGAGNSATLAMRTALGTSVAPTALTNNVTLGSVLGMGHDGTAYIAAQSGWYMNALGAWTATNHGTYHTWNAVKSGTTAYAEQMRLTNGNLLIGTTTDAGYKLDVNGSGRFMVNGTTSCLTITSNAATVPPPVLPNDTQLQFIGDDGLCSRTEYVTYGDAGILTFRRANGTGAAPTATSGNICIWIAQGYDGSAWTTSQRAAFLCVAQGTWTPTSTPTYMSWSTCPISGTVTAESMRLQPSGNLSIGTTTDAGYKLDVSGSARASTITLPIVTKTGTAYTVAATDSTVILNPSGAFTLTLPAASTNGGRILWLNLIAAFAVTSATANVIPLAGGAATTALMSAGAGKYCMLQSDVSNWQVIMAN